MVVMPEWLRSYDKTIIHSASFIG